MTDYLSQHFDWKTNEIAFSFDDFSLWSSVPGNLMLEHIEVSKHKTILDIGFGTGFPLLQLAARFGDSCNIIGVDLWKNAIVKTKQKIKARQLSNIKIIELDASKTGLPSQSIDIITSNLGINNFDHPERVIAECHRLLKTNGCLYLSSNLTGTFIEFYQVFEETLVKAGLASACSKLEKHIKHRKNLQSLKTMFAPTKFEITLVKEKTYCMRYADGTAFLKDYFAIMCFLPSWKEVLSGHSLKVFFSLLEQNLNNFAAQNGYLNLSIPLVVLKLVKT